MAPAYAIFFPLFFSRLLDGVPPLYGVRSTGGYDVLTAKYLLVSSTSCLGLSYQSPWHTGAPRMYHSVADESVEFKLRSGGYSFS